MVGGCNVENASYGVLYQLDPKQLAKSFQVALYVQNAPPWSKRFQKYVGQRDVLQAGG
jgi:hypothetical protein